MARFQMSVLYAKQKNDHETYSEEFDYTCFVKDKNNIPEIQKVVSEIVDSEIDESEDQVLFGSATVEISSTEVMVMNFKNDDFDSDKLDDIMDLIMSAPEEIIH